MSERFPGEVECVRCDQPLATCWCPKGWMENRALRVAADRRAIAAEAETARLREEVARLQRERDEAWAKVVDAATTERDTARTSLAAALVRVEAAEQVAADFGIQIIEMRNEKREAGDPWAWAVADDTGSIPSDEFGNCDHEIHVFEDEARRAAADQRERLWDAGKLPTSEECDAAVTVVPLYPSTPAAAPRTVTREWVEKWAETCAISEDMEWAGEAWDSIVTRMLADLGIQVEGDQGKETP